MRSIEGRFFFGILRVIYLHSFPRLPAASCSTDMSKSRVYQAYRSRSRSCDKEKLDRRIFRGLSLSVFPDCSCPPWQCSWFPHKCCEDLEVFQLSATKSYHRARFNIFSGAQLSSMTFLASPHNVSSRSMFCEEFGPRSGKAQRMLVNLHLSWQPNLTREQISISLFQHSIRWDQRLTRRKQSIMERSQAPTIFPTIPRSRISDTQDILPYKQTAQAHSQNGYSAAPSRSSGFHCGWHASSRGTSKPKARP